MLYLLRTINKVSLTICYGGQLDYLVVNLLESENTYGFTKTPISLPPRKRAAYEMEAIHIQVGRTRKKDNQDDDSALQPDLQQELQAQTR